MQVERVGLRAGHVSAGLEVLRDLHLELPLPAMLQVHLYHPPISGCFSVLIWEGWYSFPSNWVCANCLVRPC